jgi:hypothetical protein
MFSREFIMKKVDGFNTIEGLLALIGLLTSLIIGGICAFSNTVLFIVYLIGILMFFGIYGSKMCLKCKKNCPCNPNMMFWKNIFLKKSK